MHKTMDTIKIATLFESASVALEDARMKMIDYIECAVKELGNEVELDDLPMAYTLDGEVINTFVKGIFYEKDKELYEIYCYWYDECGDFDDGNEPLFDLTANELYSIMMFLQEKVK